MYIVKCACFGVYAFVEIMHETNVRYLHANFLLRAHVCMHFSVCGVCMLA